MIKLYTSLYVVLISISFSMNANSAKLASTPQLSTPDDSEIRFAVIGDITGGERSGVFDIAVEGLSVLKPDFILSVGDLINGGTKDTSLLNKEWSTFNNRVKKINTPFFPVVGEHDIANSVQRRWWQENVAPRYYHIRHKDILFLMLDSEDYTTERLEELARIRTESKPGYKKQRNGSTVSEYDRAFETQFGTIRNEQSEYFLQVLEDNQDVKWTFVLMHKPMWKQTRLTGFYYLERALEQRDFTVLNGHGHTYQFTKRLGQDYIQLGTTGGSYAATGDDGEYMDHVMMVSIDSNSPEPRILNLTLGGMRNKAGHIPANTSNICSGQQTCGKAPYRRKY